MVLRFLFVLFLILPLYGADGSWYDKIDVEMEAGIYKPTLFGNIKNLASTSVFRDDFNYNDAQASKFALSIMLNYDYVPNLDISYFNMRNEKSVVLTKTIQVANGTFNSSISSTVDYQVISFVLYQDFKLKGRRARFFGIPFYTGDLKFDIGINTQIFKWNFEIKNLSDLTQAPAWIRVNAFIPLPYIAAKYYWFNYRVNLRASAIAFSRVKSSVYEASVDYMLVDGLFVSAGYLYEEFKTLEQKDTVNFITSGYKVSFKYAF